MKKLYFSCLLTATLSVAYYGNAVEAVESPRAIFNQNNFPSDTVGNFPASVSFAQNSIMPSHHGVNNDVQPHLTSLRKTLVMFMPKETLSADDSVVLTARDKDNKLVYQGVMRTPDQLTRVAGQPDIDEKFDPGEFTVFSIGGHSIFTNKNNEREFTDLIAPYQYIQFYVGAHAWSHDLYLPKGKFHNKYVKFSNGSSHGYFMVHYNNNENWFGASPYSGTQVLKNVYGTWYTQDDLNRKKKVRRIEYSDKAFSATLPAKAMLPGLQLSFTSGDKNSTLTNLNIGAPNELLVHSINLGLLTPPSQNVLRFQVEPELNREYFQQIPVRRLTASQYETQHYSKVMLPDGQLLTDFDPSEGGTYDGRLRENIAKVLISQGIDNANYGINASGGIKQSWHPFLAAQITAHKAVGKHINGVYQYGHTGGEGMATLLSSGGNELSHAIGKNFGLSYHLGGFKGVVNRPANKVNSTWGWDSDNNAFIPNFNQSITNKDQCYEDQCTAPFAGHQFNLGVMSGGSAYEIAFNKYTLYTPYALNHMQKSLESKVVFSPDSPTGFTKWNDATKTMQPWSNMVKNDLRDPSSSMVEQSPYKQGVAVATLVGYYDPEQRLSSYIYPALHGSFGAVYNDPFATSACQLKVSTHNGGVRTFNLYDRQLDAGYMNKFHVNIEEALEPYAAVVTCGNAVLVKTELAPPQETLKTTVATTEKVPTGCVIDESTQIQYCLPLQENNSPHSLPDSLKSKPIYVNAEEGTRMILSAQGHFAEFVGTVRTEKLRTIKVASGETVDFSQPDSITVLKSDVPLGCIVSIETQEQYCQAAGKKYDYPLPDFIYNQPVHVKASQGVKVILSDWDNISYDHTATFTGTVSHFDLKHVKADDDSYLDVSHPHAMKVE